MKHVTFLTTPATLSRADSDSLNALPDGDDAPSPADADCRPAVDTLSALAG